MRASLFLTILVTLVFFSCNDTNQYKQAAERYFEDGKYDRALIEINKAIELEQDSVSYYGLRVMIYDILGKYKDEKLDLDKIIELNKNSNSKSIYAHHQRAIVQIQLEQFKEALFDIDYYIENRDTIGSLLEAYITKASIFYKLNDYKNSEKFYNLSLKENSGNNKSIESQALVGLSNLSKSPNKALALLDKAISIDSECALAYGARGNIYYNLGKIDKSYEDLRKAISLNANDAVSHFNLGQLFTNYTNQSDSAIFYLKKTIQLSPQSPNNDLVYMNLGILEHHLGNLNIALDYFNQGEEIAPNNDLLLYNFAMLLSDMHKNSDALEKINKALDIKPNDSEYLNLRGSIYLAQSSFQDAKKDLMKAILINPKYGGAYYNLGYLYGELNNHEQSIHHYDEAVLLNFDLESTLVNRALQKIKIDKISSACVDLKWAYRIGRTDIKPLIEKYCE